MLFKFCLAGLAAVWSLIAAPVLASICMDKSMSLEQTVDAINATDGCDSAMKLFTDCAYSASGDVELGAAVEKKCERDFHLGTAEKRAYQRRMRVCDHKYDNESGTMYSSFTAFCRAEVAQRYSRQARKTSGASVRP